MMLKTYLSLSAVLLLCSCSSSNTVSQWQGESLGSLIEEYGTPANYLKLEDGNKVIEFHYASTEKLAGNSCQLTFMVDNTNRVLGVNSLGNGVNCD
jgi:hypothetical protein